MRQSFCWIVLSNANLGWVEVWNVRRLRMVDRRSSWAGYVGYVGIIGLLLAAPSAVLAWNVQGRVACDVNGNGVIDSGEPPIGGIVVRSTALTATPGATFSGTTGPGAGFYTIPLPDHAEDYRLELTSGIPAGSNVTTPLGGVYGAPPIPPISLSPAAQHAVNVDFLLDNCNGPTPTVTATITPTAVETVPPTPLEFQTPTATPLETETPTPAVASATPAATPTDAPTATVTASQTSTPVATETGTPAVASATPEGTPTPTTTPVPTTTQVATTTPVPSATSTPGVPTATLTPSPVVTPGDFFPNHFQCYEIDRSTINTIKGIPVIDRFGATEIDVAGTGRVKRLCNPADKNGEDPTAPSDPNHLVGYVISKRTPRLAYPDQIVTNQFGSTKVSLTRPILLMVPSAKSLVGPPAPLPQPGVDHFQCYGVSNATTRVDGVQVVDQFAALTLDVKRPSRLCVAVDKRGEGILVPDAALMCYEVRSSSGTPRFTGPPGPVWVNNQFGPDETLVTRPTELCVPSSVTEAPARRRGRR
jgi:hypothetical protein